MNNAYNVGILFVSYLGLAGIGWLAYLVWPFRHDRGGQALMVLIAGLALTCAWLLAVDVVSLMTDRVAPPMQPARVLVPRGLLTVSVWATLWAARWRR